MVKEMVIHLPKNLSIAKLIEFVNKANKYKSDVIIDMKHFKTNGKSLLSFSLAVLEGNKILIRAEGSDALQAIEHLSSIFKLEEEKIGDKETKTYDTVFRGNGWNHDPYDFDRRGCSGSSLE
ncbi:MAG TPA: HPr family phosphocarrier protein [Bacillota bacterium]|nr:HPr family phosphocarrier protein [Bacillota bacterium]